MESGREENLEAGGQGGCSRVRDAGEGLGKDRGSGNGEEKTNLTDILEVDLIGLSELISH